MTYIDATQLGEITFENNFFWSADTPDERKRWRQWAESLPAERREWQEAHPPWSHDGKRPGHLSAAGQV